MYERPPDAATIAHALNRWQGGGNRPGTLGIAAHIGTATQNKVLQALRDLGSETTITPLIGEDGAIAPALRTVDVLVPGVAALTAETLDQLACRMIFRPSVGYDGIDLAAATARGIMICNIPDAYSEEVALQAIAFLMAANRQLAAFERELREGQWRGGIGTRVVIHNPKAQTVGIVGFGRIGRHAAMCAKALGFRVIATDPYVPADAGAALGVPLVSLEEVLRESDYVSIHCLLWEGTHHLMNAERFALMKPGAWLINTARGPIVDEAALVTALRSGHLGGAGLDVMEVEPITPDNPLLALPNVHLSPHMAVYSEEGAARTLTRAAEIVAPALRGKLPDRAAAIDKGLYDALAARL